MPDLREHVCPDCGRRFTSGAALGGHRRVHTKGRLKEKKGYKASSNRKPRKINNNNNNNNNNTHNLNILSKSPEPYNESKFYGQYITDVSSDEHDDNNIHNSHEDSINDYHYNSMPPPIKKRKLNSHSHSHNNNNIGYIVQPPSNIKKATKMDAIREQIGLAMNLYHFNVDLLSSYCNIPSEIFIKWLQGGIIQKRNIGINTATDAHGNSNSNSNSNKHNKNKNQNKSSVSVSSKAPILKIKFKKKRIKNFLQKKDVIKHYYLTPNLADQIAEKMKKWLDNFIYYGFTDKHYLKYVHHYKRYGNSSNNSNSNSVHDFGNRDMKFNKLYVDNDNREFMRNINTNSSFDWFDDSSFYYSSPNPNQKQKQNDVLIPITINEIINGKLYRDTILWNNSPNNKLLISEFVGSLLDDLNESRNHVLRENIQNSFNKQIKEFINIENKYLNELNIFRNKNRSKLSSNYFQHLSSNSSHNNLYLSECNLMNNISDITHGTILIKLNLTYNNNRIKLIDEFLWNINDISNNNYIEEFSHNLCCDQGLPFHFISIISHNIRKQINEYKIKLTKYFIKNDIKSLNKICDPILYEPFRYVGRKKKRDLRNIKVWQPTILVNKQPNKMKTRIRTENIAIDNTSNT